MDLGDRLLLFAIIVVSIGMLLSDFLKWAGETLTLIFKIINEVFHALINIFENFTAFLSSPFHHFTELLGIDMSDVYTEEFSAGWFICSWLAIFGAMFFWSTLIFRLSDSSGFENRELSVPDFIPLLSNIAMIVAWYYDYSHVDGIPLLPLMFFSSYIYFLSLITWPCVRFIFRIRPKEIRLRIQIRKRREPLPDRRQIEGPSVVRSRRFSTPKPGDYW